MYKIRCTRRLRDPLQHLILQPTDLSTVQGAVYTRHAVMATFYLPLANLQAVMHKRYEAEQVAEMVLPPGVAPPPVRALTLTEQNILASGQCPQNNNNNNNNNNSNNLNSEKNLKTFAALRHKMGGKYVPPTAPTAAKRGEATTTTTATAPSSPSPSPLSASSFWRPMEADSKEQIHRAPAGAAAQKEKDGARRDYSDGTTSEPYMNQMADGFYKQNEKGETIVPLGLVTLIIGENYPLKGQVHQLASTQPHLKDQNGFYPYDHNYNLFDKFFYHCVDPVPYTTLSLRCLVMDRIQWQRTSWLAGSICSSWCWGKLPQKIFSINLDYKHPVYINGGDKGDATAAQYKASEKLPVAFDTVKNQYTSAVQVEVPFHRFKLQLKDTGVSLFNTHIAQHPQPYNSRDEEQFRLHNRVVDGFLENESAFHRLALSREVNMLGLGGSVYRQTLWSSPALPNLASAITTTTTEGSDVGREAGQPHYGTLFQHYFGCDPVGGPVASWLCHEIPRTFIYQMEGEVEDENDPNSATTYGDRSLTERVQKKAMNRYNDFRSEVRQKTYSDIDGSEVPR